MSTTLPRRSQQQRTEHTRSQLLQAAEQIFARDGFAAAKLEDISARAGYTRGAFYANFSSKEDLFIAMLEGEVLKRVAALRDAVFAEHSPQEKLMALRRYVICAGYDRTWAVLFTEFRLFTLRRRELQARLRSMHRRIFSVMTAVMGEVFSATGTKLPTSTLAFAISMGGFANSLELDRRLTHSIKESEISTILGLLFDAATAQSNSLGPV